MEVHQNDMKTFYRLVNSNKSSSNKIFTELWVGDEDCFKDQEEILEGWKLHFKTLATPKGNQNTEKSECLQFDVDTIENILTEEFHELFYIVQIKQAVKDLNTNKAADAYNFTAAHLKFGGTALPESLSRLVNRIMITGKVHDCFKKGQLSQYIKRKETRTMRNAIGV